MKRFSLLLILSLFTISSIKAQYIWQNNLSVVNDKAYRLESTNTNKLNLIQYSFPALTELKRIELEGKLYSTNVEAFESGILVKIYNYEEALPIEISDTEETASELRTKFNRKFDTDDFSPADENIYTEKIKNISYDIDLNKVSELTTEIKYTYYWVDDVASVSGDVSEDSSITKVSNGLCQESNKKKKKRRKNQDCIKAEL